MDDVWRQEVVSEDRDVYRGEYLAYCILRAAINPHAHDPDEPTMSVDNVAQAVLYMASLPPNANVLSMTVMTTKMPFVGRG